MIRKSLEFFAAAFVAVQTCLAYDHPTHDKSYTTNGVTYAQRGGLGSSDYVVTNVDAEALVSVKSVNGLVGDVELSAADVGAVSTYAKFSEDTGSYLNWNYALKGLAFGFNLNDPQILITDAPFGEIRHPRRTDEKWDWLVTWDGSTLQDSLDSYVPTTRKINGQPLTQDLTIQGMPDNALVLTNGVVKTTDGAKTIEAADVGAFPARGGVITGAEGSYTDITGYRITVYNGYFGETVDLNPMSGVSYKGWTFAGGHIKNEFGTDLYFPFGVTGEFAVNSWSSLRSMLTDATTNTNADRECISTNICKLIEPHIEPVNVIAELYDGTKKVLWSVTIDNGDMKYGAKTNVDTTAYMQANSVLKDKSLNTNWKVRIDNSEMKFDALVRQQ